MSSLTQESNNNPGWFERFVNFCYAASMQRVVGQMRIEAHTSYSRMINDLKAPMTPEFEATVARYIDGGIEDSLIPAKTLMPSMLDRFGLSEGHFSEREAELKSMRKTCNNCEVVGRCWKALRADAAKEECIEFCPNSSRMAYIATAEEVAH